jgi:hypothetical protein
VIAGLVDQALAEGAPAATCRSPRRQADLAMLAGSSRESARGSSRRSNGQA